MSPKLTGQIIINNSQVTQPTSHNTGSSGRAKSSGQAKTSMNTSATNFASAGPIKNS